MDDVRAEGESSVADVLKRGSRSKDEVWIPLRDKLVDRGISAEMAEQNRDAIISDLRGRMEKDDLLCEAKNPLRDTDTKPAPVKQSSESTTPATSPDRPSSLYDQEDSLLADEPTGLPFLPLPPIGFSYSPSYSNQARPPLSEQTSPIDEFPIPVAVEKPLIAHPTDCLLYTSPSPRD